MVLNSSPFIVLCGLGRTQSHSFMLFDFQMVPKKCLRIKYRKNIFKGNSVFMDGYITQICIDLVCVYSDSVLMNIIRSVPPSVLDLTKKILKTSTAGRLQISPDHRAYIRQGKATLFIRHFSYTLKNIIDDRRKHRQSLRNDRK